MRYYHLIEERITQAAFWDRERGEAIPTGAFHDIYRLPPHLFNRVGKPDQNEYIIDGYLTDEGRFLNRKDAAILVKKQQGYASRQSELDSEDLEGLGKPGKARSKYYNPKIS